MQDYRWVWTVIVLLIICFALISALRVYWREWGQRRRARRASRGTSSARGDADADRPG